MTNNKTTLKEIHNILKSKDKKEEYEFIKPTRPERNVIFNDFNIPSKNYQTKIQLSKVLAFIDMKKHTRFSNGLTVMNISCKNKRLLSMCGTPKSVSRLIQFMINIGLLAEYDSSYRFNAFDKTKNRSKSYCYKYETEELIKDYCVNNQINKYKITLNKKYNNKDNIDTIVDTIKSFDVNQVKISSKVNFLKPDNYTEEQFNDYLSYHLFKKYPQLEYYMDLADLINEVYFADDDSRKITFQPNFKYGTGNKCVKKIGIRATNSLCNIKKVKENDDRENQIYRDDILEQYGLNEGFDVKSSVPRVTYLINNGVWLDSDIDLYEKMYERFIEKCPSEKDEWNKETREVFKYFHMRGYFDTYSMCGAHIKREISKKTEYKKHEWEDVDYVMKSYKESIEETLGGIDYDSEIFLHESCIYLDVLFELLKRGYDVLQIYDAFYTNKKIEDIEEIIKEKAIKYYNKYIKINNNDNNNSNNIDTIVDTINNYGYEEQIELPDRYKIEHLVKLKNE